MEDESLPLFPVLLRGFYKRVHPDLLRAQSPVEAGVNDSSMKELNSVLSTVKVNKSRFNLSIIHNGSQLRIDYCFGSN